MRSCLSLMNLVPLSRVLPAMLVMAGLCVSLQAHGASAYLSAQIPASTPSPSTSAATASAPAVEQQVRGIGQVVTGIASYVKWPVSQNELQLCVAGETRYAETLMDGSARARNQLIHAMRLPASMPAVLLGCDIVYLGNLAPAERHSLLSRISGQPVLSISEPSLPCEEQVMFCLKIRDDQIAFEANLDAINISGLKVHPNVLQLARRKGRP